MSGLAANENVGTKSAKAMILVISKVGDVVIVIRVFVDLIIRLTVSIAKHGASGAMFMLFC